VKRDKISVWDYLPLRRNLAQCGRILPVLALKDQGNGVLFVNIEQAYGLIHCI
jgi:hypothetical protein